MIELELADIYAQDFKRHDLKPPPDFKIGQGKMIVKFENEDAYNSYFNDLGTIYGKLLIKNVRAYWRSPKAIFIENVLDKIADQRDKNKGAKL